MSRRRANSDPEDNNFIVCPVCGKKMSLSVRVMGNRSPFKSGEMHWIECAECGLRTTYYPTRDAALKSFIRKPPTTPYSYNQVLSSLPLPGWLQLKDDAEAVRPCLVLPCPRRGVPPIIYTPDGEEHHAITSYDITWRLWPKKPYPYELNRKWCLLDNEDYSTCYSAPEYDGTAPILDPED